MNDPNPTPALTARDVTMRYDAARAGDETPALEGFDLELDQGEFCAIVGPSGCGKTTFLNLVAGFATPTSGSIHVDGAPVTGPGPDRGVVFQDYALFPWKTVINNVAFGPRSRGRSKSEAMAVASQWLGTVGLAGSEHKYPHELSGGMRQRCSLARVFANDPSMLLMDEPMAAVDAQTRRILQDELLDLWGESGAREARKTVLYITHSIEEAVYLADTIIVMASRPGRVRDRITNPLPRPRRPVHGSPEYARTCEQIWDLLRADASMAIRTEATP